MPFDEDNVYKEPLKTKVDTITSLLTAVIIVLLFTLTMLALSHRSFDSRLDQVEAAIRSERR
jgi:hypothetical protein